MVFWNLFSKKKKSKTKRRTRHTQGRQNIDKLKTDIEDLRVQIRTINIALEKHDDRLAEHESSIEKNSRKIADLEQLVATAPLKKPDDKAPLSDRPIAPAMPSALPKIPVVPKTNKFDIDGFSFQEKRILNVFFQNQDMALSYKDIATSLNKSPNTIKNQMHQINIKANLFYKTVDPDGRNRFKVKDDLRIEKYLNTR